MRRIIGGIYRKIIHPILLYLYFKFIGLINVLKWMKNLKKIDVCNLQSLLKEERIHPLKPEQWHEDTEYFWSFVNGDKVYIKRTTNNLVYENEVKIYNSLKSKDSPLLKKCPKLLYSFSRDKYRYLIYEFIYFPSLSKIKLSALIKDEKQKLVKEIYDIYNLLLNENICHNDIRRENFFVKDDLSVKIFDFGYSCFYSERDDFIEKLTTEEKEALNQDYRPTTNMLDDSYSLLLIMKKVNGNLYSEQHEIWEFMNQMTGQKSIRLVKVECSNDSKN